MQKIKPNLHKNVGQMALSVCIYLLHAFFW